MRMIMMIYEYINDEILTRCVTMSGRKNVYWTFFVIFFTLTFKILNFVDNLPAFKTRLNFGAQILNEW